MEVPRSLQWAPSCHQLPPASSSWSTVFAPTFGFLASHLAISVYRGGIANDYNCAVPLDPLMQSFHATLGAHHHSPYHCHSPSHPHTYPSQHLPYAQPLVEHIVRMVEPPSLREESIRSGHDDDFHLSSTHQYLPPHSRCAGAPSPFSREPGLGSMAPMPTTTCQLSSMRLPRQTSTTPTAKTAVKRLYHVLTTSPSLAPKRTMTEDDKLLFNLRVQQKLPWKMVARCFGEFNRRQFTVPTLQMRYTRLKNRFPEMVPEKESKK